DPKRTFNLDFDGNAWFPVLTAPLAEKGPHSMVCPPEHVQALRSAVSRADKILFVGTSGLDTDLLEVMEGSVGHPGTVGIVARNDEDAVRVARNIGKRAPSLLRAGTLNFEAGFDEFVNEKRENNLESFARL